MEHLAEIQTQLGLGALAPMAFDVSTRRYFRAPGGIVMVDQDDGFEARIHRFVDVAERLRKEALRAPEIYIAAPDQGYLYMEDFGDQSLKDAPSAENYRAAFLQIEAIRGVDAVGLTPYSQAIYLEEMSRLMRFYLAPLGIEDQELLMLAAPVLEMLEADGSCFVHLDFHAENLMVLEDDAIGLIDIQDARGGHRLYDLASFVDDVRAPMPKKIATRVIEALNLEDDFHFHTLSAQRLIKIMGIFARMTGEGREKYQALLPDVYALALKRLAHGELSLWHEWFMDVVPAPDDAVLMQLKAAGNG